MTDQEKLIEVVREALAYLESNLSIWPGSKIHEELKEAFLALTK